ncbi:TPA: lipoprotein [Neisseria gonorrhoeae]
MKYGVFFAAATALLLSACGYKGGLYLPKEGDTARFGVIQTGL